MTRVPMAIVGTGRMGQAVRELAPSHGFDVVAMLGREETRGELAAALRGAAVVIEFTAPGSAAGVVRRCLDAGCAVVSGTTGWDAELDGAREHATLSRGGALLWSPNFSPGMALFAELVRLAGVRFTPTLGFDAHLVETHHAAKKDAPSGTAVMLAAECPSPPPITSVRVGSVPGVHELVLDARFEQVVLRHEARDRRVFADGALRAARWLAGRRGVYTFRDVLMTSQET